MTVCAHALKRGDRANPTNCNSNMLLSKRIKASCTRPHRPLNRVSFSADLTCPGVLRYWSEAEQLVPQRKLRDE